MTLQELVYGVEPPSDWEATKLKRILRARRNNKNQGMKENNLLSLSYGRIVQKDIDTSEGLLPESFETYQIVEAGDIVVRLTDLQNDKRSLRQGLVRERGIITSAYDALEVTKGHDSSFWAYALLALDHAKYYYSMGGGVRQSVKFDDFPNSWIAAPNLKTQKAVASFLDREVDRIDQLIEKKKRQVRLLNEKRSSLINRLVFGEHLPGEKQNTNVAWIPPLPSDWQIQRLSRVFENFDHRRIPLSSIERADLAKIYPYYGASGIIDQIDRYIFDEDLILVGEDGANLVYQSTPIAFIATGKYWVNNHAHILKPKRGPLEYWTAALNQVPFEVFVTGSAQPKLTSEALGSIPLPIPPIGVQKIIAGQIQLATLPIGRMMDAVNRSIERLRERRAALITSVVSGQIDVKGQTHDVSAKVDKAKFRVVVGAEIVHRHQGNPKFGRVKLQKELYLAEAHVGIDELGGNYLRYAAGPYDGTLIQETERGLEAAAFYRAEPANGDRRAVSYAPLANAGRHIDELKSLLGPRLRDLQKLIALLCDFDKDTVEAITTLYAIWNDTLMDGDNPDDTAIIRGFLTEWHRDKERFKDGELRHWLAWMRRNDLVPRGRGPRTAHTMTRDMFA